MSIFENAEVKCPKCERAFEFRIWNTMNATLDPEVEERILDGTLTLATCPTCGNEFHVLYETLYHDMDREFMVEFRAPDHWNLVDGAIDVPELDKTLRQYRFLRKVTSWNELREKVLIFTSELDDVVIEVIKAILLTQEFDVDEPKDGLLRFGGLLEGDGTQKLVFEIMWETEDEDEDEDEENAVHLPMSLYQQIASAVGDQPEHRGNGEFIAVNQSTVAPMLREMGKG